MAMTHKFLKALGIEDDKAEEIIAAHLETVNAIKAERDELKTKAETVDTLTAERDQLKADLQAAKAAGGDAAKVQADFDAYKAEIETEKTNGNKRKLLRTALEKAGANPAALDLLVNTLKLDEVELDGENLKDADKVIAPVKTGYASLFGTQQTTGTSNINPISGSKHHGTGRAAEIAAKYYADMYGAPATGGKE